MIINNKNIDTFEFCFNVIIHSFHMLLDILLDNYNSKDCPLKMEKISMIKLYTLYYILLCKRPIVYRGINYILLFEQDFI